MHQLLAVCMCASVGKKWEGFGDEGRVSSVRVQGVYDWIFNALRHSLAFGGIWLLPSSLLSLLIILPADEILKSDLAAMGFSFVNLSGSREKTLSIQETVILRAKSTEKLILIHLSKVNSIISENRKNY